LIVPTFAWIMITETVNDSIPERFVSSDQLGFYWYNQIAFNVAKNHETTAEVVNAQVSHLLYAVCVFA